MPVDLTLTINIAEDLRRRLGPAILSDAIVKGMNRVVFGVVRRAKENLSGRFLNVGLGRLRASITKDVRVEGTDIVGRVGTNVWYGKLHEFGGTFTYSRTIGGSFRRTRAGALRFTKRGDPRVVAQVIPTTKRITVTLPSRPWLRTAALETRPEVLAAFQLEIRKALGGNA
jgi:phage gpG-like protein